MSSATRYEKTADVPIEVIMRGLGYFKYDAEGKFLGLNRAFFVQEMTEETPVRLVAMGSDKFVVRFKEEDIIVRADETREEVWIALIKQHCQIVFIAVS
jgi:hypothetical protein